MPVDINDEANRFIRTLVVSELISAVFERADTEEREPFALYCDEFQEFATPDFAKLFTQTGKFNIMPAVAHQVRGQFRPLDPNRDAALGAPNKIVFGLSPADARELAPVFADEPVTELKPERILTH